MNKKTQKREKTELGARLEKALEAAGVSQNELARRLKIRQSTVSGLISGESKGSKHIVEMAQVLGQDPLWLQMGVGQMRQPSRVHETVTSLAKREVPWITNIVMVKVVGAVQAGVWGPALEWSYDDHKEIPVILDQQYNGLTLIGLEMIGPSMDKYYPHRSVAVCASYIELKTPPAHMDHVVVQHWRGDEVEATVKEFRIDEDGIQRLWPCSTHPDFQSPLKVAKPPRGEEIRITHKVVGAFIKRP